MGLKGIQLKAVPAFFLLNSHSVCGIFIREAVNHCIMADLL